MVNTIPIDAVTAISLFGGTRNLHSFITDGTTIYGGTRQSPARIVEISGGVVTTKIMPSTVNPAYTNTLDLVYSNIENMALHELTGHFYANFHNQTRADSIRVIEFYNDGTEIVYADVISESWNWLRETKPTIAVIAIDNDNDYLYAATWRSEASSLECTIRRYDLINRDIDGLLLLLDTYTIPISPFNRAHSLTIDGDYLYLTSQGTAPWVVKVNINGTMALVDGYQLSSDFIVITDDAAISDGRLWVGIEAGTYTGAMVGLNIDDLSDIEIIEFPEAFPCYGVFAISDRLFAVHFTTYPMISEINTSDNSLITFKIPDFVGGISELLFLDDAFYAPTWVGFEEIDSEILSFESLDPYVVLGDVDNTSRGIFQVTINTPPTTSLEIELIRGVDKYAMTIPYSTPTEEHHIVFPNMFPEEEATFKASSNGFSSEELITGAAITTEDIVASGRYHIREHAHHYLISPNDPGTTAILCVNGTSGDQLGVWAFIENAGVIKAYGNMTYSRGYSPFTVDDPIQPFYLLDGITPFGSYISYVWRSGYTDQYTVFVKICMSGE